MGLLLNQSYVRAEIRDVIPGVHPQRALTRVRDHIGGLVLMLRQRTEYDYSSAFDTAAREMWMDIKESATAANERLQTMTPIRLCYWRLTRMGNSAGYRYLGFVAFDREDERGGRINYVFNLLDPTARISDLPQLQVM